MQEISIRFIGRENTSDINIKNESMEWECFPDENYSFEEMEKDHVFAGAYDGDLCIGLAIFRHQWNKYIYLHDLKVNGKYRGQQVANKMLDFACGYLFLQRV